MIAKNRPRPRARLFGSVSPAYLYPQLPLRPSALLLPTLPTDYLTPPSKFSVMGVQREPGSGINWSNIAVGTF